MSFSMFAHLPYELRSHIWSLAVEPRRLTNVRVEMIEGKFTKKQRQRGRDVLHETTSTPPPVLMHACRESRSIAPYRRAFTAGAEPRWTWVNFDLDIFCVSSLHAISQLSSHRSEIQRLEIRTDCHPHSWYDSATIYGSLRILDEFASLREIRVILEPRDLMWEDVYTNWNVFGVCPRENITFLDEGTGLVLTGSQLRMVSDWGMFFSFDVEYNPPEPDNISEAIEYALDGDSHMTMAQMYDV